MLKPKLLASLKGSFEFEMKIHEFLYGKQLKSSGCSEPMIASFFPVYDGANWFQNVSNLWLVRLSNLFLLHSTL